MSDVFIPLTEMVLVLLQDKTKELLEVKAEQHSTPQVPLINLLSAHWTWHQQEIPAESWIKEAEHEDPRENARNDSINKLSPR